MSTKHWIGRGIAIAAASPLLLLLGVLPASASQPGGTTSADLSIVKRDPEISPATGAQAVYSLVVSNHGPDAAQNVVVTDRLRENAAFVSAVGADCVPDGQYLSCRVAILPMGQDCLIEIRTLTIQGPGAPAPGSEIQNTASVTSDTPDPDTANNKSQIVKTMLIPMVSTIAAGAIGLAGAGVGILYILRRRRRNAVPV